jgi:hypothetical protein
MCVKIVGGKTLNESDLGKLRLRKENNFKWILKELEQERVDCVYLAWENN